MFFKNKNKKILSSSKDKVVDYTKKVTSFETVKENFDDIKNLYDTLASPSSVKNNDAKQSKIGKTFSQLAREKGLTQDDLNQIYFNYSISFYISLFFAIVCFFTGIYMAFVKLAFIPFVACISILLVCLANAFRFSFSAFKVKHQKFCSVQDWLQSTEQWFPKIRK